MENKARVKFAAAVPKVMIPKHSRLARRRRPRGRHRDQLRRRVVWLNWPNQRDQVLLECLVPAILHELLHAAVQQRHRRSLVRDLEVEIDMFGLRLWIDMLGLRLRLRLRLRHRLPFRLQQHLGSCQQSAAFAQQGFRHHHCPPTSKLNRVARHSYRFEPPT